MNDDRKAPPDPATDQEEEGEGKRERVPPYEPDYDAIAYMEGGQGPDRIRRRVPKKVRSARVAPDTDAT